MTQPFSLLVKPASADCNLKCDYCFYYDRCRLYPDDNRHRMSEATLERMIRTYLATEQGCYSFGWQGGEPTLMGVAFFRRVTELQKQYGRPGAIIANGLQTNATLITDDLAEHFAQYQYLLGVSLDGPEEIHDFYRRRTNGAGSFSDVISGIETLNRHQVEFNILVLVNDRNVTRATEIYRFLCDRGFTWQQYIPCVEFSAAGEAMPFTITGRQWGDFLCELFDCWRRDGVGRVSIRLFDAIINILSGRPAGLCQLMQNCCQYFVVEHNGDIYPCDFFVSREHKLGNIHHDEWQSLQESEAYRQFGEAKCTGIDRCMDCSYLKYCWGDCQKHRPSSVSGSEQSLSWLCAGRQQFYQHCLPHFERIVDDLNRRQAGAMVAVPPATRRKIGRNEPCPCGSGRKYKKCCMPKQGSLKYYQGSH